MKNKFDRDKVVKIPALITNISKLPKKWVKIKICGKVGGDIQLGKEYDISIVNLAIPSQEESWNAIADIMS